MAFYVLKRLDVTGIRTHNLSTTTALNKKEIMKHDCQFCLFKIYGTKFGRLES